MPFDYQEEIEQIVKEYLLLMIRHQAMTIQLHRLGMMEIALQNQSVLKHTKIIIPQLLKLIPSLDSFEENLLKTPPKKKE